jgi:hypothetical protein
MNPFLQYVPLALLAVLLFLMLRNRAYKVCPVFFAYVAFGAGADMARFITDGHKSAYFATYWTTEAGYCLLGILVMYELLRMALRSLARKRWARPIFLMALVMGVALSLAHAHSVPPRFVGLRYYLRVGEIAIRYVQVLIFIALGALATLALPAGHGAPLA